MQLTNKIIFITGGASGIGEACVEAYVREGASVFVMDRDENSLQKLLNKIGNNHQGIVGDVQNGDNVQKAIETALSVFGRIDAIHNNAGIESHSKPIHETTENEWDSLFSINLKSVYWTTKFGIDALKITKGCILNTSSMRNGAR
jgi:NADP-dependent 3-hydroxy acid dehydrogenase YdfG